MFIKITGKDKGYIGTLTLVSNNVIRVEKLPKSTVGFQLYLNKKYERVVGDYSQYTTVYRVVDEKNDIYEYSNDGSKYVAPIIEPPIIEEPQVYTKTIEEVRTAKIAHIKDQSEYIIKKGETVTLSDGSQDEFNYSQTNQMNLANAFNLAVATKESVPYYDKDNLCKIYSPEDIVRIYSSCQILVTYHVTLAHQLVDQINNMDSIEKIEALEYSYDSLDKKHKANFDAVMKQTQKIAQKVFAQ